MNIRSDDGVRVWIGAADATTADTLILDEWYNTGAVEHASAAISMEAGKLYPIRVEYYDAGGAAVSELSWQSASQAKEIIPGEQLYTPAGRVDTSHPELEGGNVHLRGQINDADAQDSFRLTINWGDGTVRTYAYPVGTTTFDVVHAYANESSTAGYTITATVTDQTGLTSSPVSVNQVVGNVSPIATLSGPTVSAESLPVFIESNVIDPGLNDTFSYEWTVTKDGQPYAAHPVHESATVMTFDGIDDFVEIPDSDSLHRDRQLTVSGWFKADNLNAAWQAVYWKGNTPEGTQGNSNREVAFYVNGGNGSVQFVSTPDDQTIGNETVGQLAVSSPAGTVKAGNWYHFATVIDADSDFMGIYLNGELVASRTYSAAGFRDTTGPLVFGNTASLNNPLTGSLDDIQVWSAARSGEEIRADMFRELAGSETNLVGYWKFNESGGSSVLDSSPLANHGSFISPPLRAGVTGALPADSNTAFDFYGRSGIEIDVPQVNTTPGGYNTVSFWMNWNGQNGDMPFGFTTYDLWLAGGAFGFNTGVSDIYGISSEGLANRWVHVTAAFHNGAGTLSKLWIDGAEQQLSQRYGSTTSRTATTTARISGWVNNTGYQFDGQIDEFAMFNRELTSAEVAAQYAARNQAPGAAGYDGTITAQNPQAYYRLGDASTSTITDSSGNGNHGTPVGSDRVSAPVRETITAAGSGNISFTPDDNGTYVVQLTVTDNSGATSGVITHTLTVIDIAPIVTISGPDQVEAATPYTLQLGSSDVGDDTISSWFINWGDGSDPDNDGQVGETISGNPSSATHTFAYGGDYTIVATATNEDGQFQASSGYTTTVLNDSPIAFWRMNETVGNKVFNLGTGGVALGGTVYGGAQLGQPGLLPASIDKAIEFDGINDWVLIPNHPELNTGVPISNRTIEFWFRADDVNRRQVVFEEGAGSRGLNIYIDDDPDSETSGMLYMLGWNFPNDDGGVTTPWQRKWVSVPIEAGEVYHMAMVLEHTTEFDGTIAGYLNGESFGEIDGVGRLFGHGGDVRLGSSYDAVYHEGPNGGGAFFDGVIDEVAIYNSSLSGSRLLKHYVDGSSGLTIRALNEAPAATSDT